MSRFYLFAGLATVLFVAVSVAETLRSGEVVTWFSLGADLLETLLLAAAVIFTARASFETRLLRNERRDLLADLHQSKAESAQWRETARRHVEGLSDAIAAQFRAWRLTEAEADVAALMLKGLSHREIAVLRDSSEATVRQHAAQVYAKSGVSNRAQLTGFFLEDLLAPTAAAPDLQLVAGPDAAGTSNPTGSQGT